MNADSSTARRKVALHDRSCKTIWDAISSKIDNRNRIDVCQPFLLSSIVSIFGCNVYTGQRLGPIGLFRLVCSALVYACFMLLCFAWLLLLSLARDALYLSFAFCSSHSAWIKRTKEIDGFMLMTMEPEIQRNLEPFHAHEMLKELKTLFAQQAEQELLQTTRDFHSCRQEEGQSVNSYVLKMKGYIDNLERLGHPVILGLGVSLILLGLRKEYDGFLQNYNMHNMRKTFNELHAMLKLYEQTLPKSNAPALNAIRAGKV
nr:zinc finger, CCHC-type [Tanacetum cinerariifolium]